MAPQLRQFRQRWRCPIKAVTLMVMVTTAAMLNLAATANPQTNLLNKGCSQYNATNLSNFYTNLNDTFSQLRSQLSGVNTKFATGQQAKGSDPVYAMAQCRDYLSTLDCVACFDAAVVLIRNCTGANGARVIYDGCFLRLVFSQYGPIEDAFLSNRRSRRSGNKFGFVKFRERRGATLAMAKANGLRFGYRSLFVERARYDGFSNRNRPHSSFSNPSDDREVGVEHTFNQRVQSHVQARASQIPNPGDLKERENRVTLNFQPIAADWLTTSLVARLKQITTTEYVLEGFSMIGFQNVVVKSMGGLDLIITFQSKEDRLAALSNSTILGWFKYIKPWNGEASGKSRLVWLKCRGIPLNTWCLTTFRRIGKLWGDFISLDYETLKEESYEVGRMMIATDNSNRIDDWINITVRGRNYGVKVWEEECDDPFNERHIRDWVKVHIPASTENPKIKEAVFGRDDDVEGGRNLAQSSCAALDGLPTDREVMRVDVPTTLLLKDGSSRLLHVPREDIINTGNVVQESEESVVGESADNNDQPTSIEEPQVEPPKNAEDQHKENRVCRPDPILDPLVEHIIQNQAVQNGISKEARVKKRRQLTEILDVKGPLSHLAWNNRVPLILEIYVTEPKLFSKLSGMQWKRARSWVSFTMRVTKKWLTD
ncbi:hypothetical protein RHMOL_Rhmol10G0268100 [Rhododendron molle]|uniref:Uncharacterized protein n=1 Tax=Rhododendron molle TaxID=49168 RepID=A0ACC0M6I1_RHOML|nr:hypothetical protein RHMOL_Rhmol10G0268100 [Rhododendron molle]